MPRTSSLHLLQQCFFAFMSITQSVSMRFDSHNFPLVGIKWYICAVYSPVHARPLEPGTDHHFASGLADTGWDFKRIGHT